jgi:hypothetical protein
MSLSQWLKPQIWLSTVQTLPEPVRNGLFRAAVILAPMFIFVAFFSPFIVDPTRVGWLLDEDWGQHVLGWNAFRREPWSTINHEYMLGAPVGNSLFSTDSNPLFAFIFKPFAAILPDRFQYIGPWFLFCMVMHFVFAWKLVRPHAPNRWAALGGAIALSLLPMLTYRMRHDTLVAQWLVLWSLHIFINVQGENRKTIHWAALLGLSGLIHPYLLFMVAAIWGGDVLRSFWPAARALDRKALLDVTWRALCVLAFPIVALGIGGAYVKGMSPGAGGYGYYSFPLDGWINPVRDDFSQILKAWPLDGGQYFEGYQYLGFGLIVLVVAAAVLYITTPEAKQSRAFFSGLKYLTLPFIALFLIAVSNHAQFYGYTVWHFDLPQWLRGPAAVLRASGRLVWPITYCLILAALVVLFKSRPKLVGIILPAVLIIQAYDISGVAKAMRKATSLATGGETYFVTPSPVWDELVTHSKGVDFYPPNVHMNDRLFYELTWRATSQAKPVNTMYAARQNLIQLTHERAGKDAFKRGTVRNDRLFVFLKQCDVPAALQSSVRMVDGVWVIPPEGARNLPLDKPLWDPIKSRIKFGWLDQGNCLIDENWNGQEYDGIWSDGREADIMVPIRAVEFKSEPKALDLNLKAKSRVPATVAVLVNGTLATTLELNHRAEEYTVPLPAAVLGQDSLNIRFVIASSDEAPVKLAALRNVGGRSPPPKAHEAPAPSIKLMNMEFVERPDLHDEAARNAVRALRRDS